MVGLLTMDNAGELLAIRSAGRHSDLAGGGSLVQAVDQVEHHLAQPTSS